MPSSPGARALPDVVFALTGDVRRNSRALKQLRALAGLGCDVLALGLGPAAEEDVLDESIRVRILPRPPGGGPRFFLQVHRLMKEVAAETPARVYHASDLYTLPALGTAAQRHGGKLVYDARELYPHVASTAGRPWVSWFWTQVEGRHVRSADAVFTVSASIAERMAASYGIAPPPVLHNVPPYQPVAPTNALRERTGLHEETVVLLHQGQIQKARGCALLADAMRDVTGAALVFLGGGPLKPALQEQVAQAGFEDRVFFLDPVPPDDLLPVTASADVGITLLEDTCLNHRFALPNKLFEYLMAGLPVLASDLPEIRRVIEGCNVGKVVDPSDRATLVKTLQQMTDDADARRRFAANAPRVFETFSWEQASERFEEIYRNLLI